MKFSVLHISDLHRDLTDEIENGWLLDSLAQDFTQFSKQSPEIKPPDLCVVSGDLVYGVKLGTPNAATELTRQYTQAEEFLIGLTDRFLGGKRERLIIVPGNHDVSFEAAAASWEKLDIPSSKADKAMLLKELITPKSRLRWSWQDFCFYRIVDEDRYQSRFEYFSAMYSRFYNGHRSFSSRPDEQFDVFDFPEFHLSILALNSCYNNDPFRRAGELHPVALATVAAEARKAERSGWLIAATWHHNLAGAPQQDDYLDPGFIQILIDAGVTISFHGHQHLSECFDERYRLGPNSRKMTVISAGTLCAEPKNLRPGVPRSYNIVELDTQTWQGRVHQRQMANMMFNLPIWGPGFFINTNTSYFDFTICQPLSERPAKLDLQIALDAAEKLVGEKRWREAIDALVPLKHIPIAKPFLLKALGELNDARCTITSLMAPTTTAEAVMLGGALLEGGTAAELESYINTGFVFENHDSSIREICQRIKRRLSK